jgi:hypothetical protein
MVFLLVLLGIGIGIGIQARKLNICTVDFLRRSIHQKQSMGEIPDDSHDAAF